MPQPVQMTLGPCTEQHPLVLCDVAPLNLLDRDCLSKLKELIHFACNGELALEFPGQPDSDLLRSLQSVHDIEGKGFQQKNPLI